MTTLLAQYSATPVTTMPPQAAIAAAMGAFAVATIIGLVITVISIFAIYKIAGRAGYNPWLSLLSIIPGVSFILLLVFAFSEWPIQRENRLLKAQAGGSGTPGAVSFGDAASGYLPGRGPLPPA